MENDYVSVQACTSWLLALLPANTSRDRLVLAIHIWKESNVKKVIWVKVNRLTTWDHFVNQYWLTVETSHTTSHWYRPTYKLLQCSSVYRCAFSHRTQANYFLAMLRFGQMFKSKLDILIQVFKIVTKYLISCGMEPTTNCCCREIIISLKSQSRTSLNPLANFKVLKNMVAYNATPKAPMPDYTNVQTLVTHF